VNADEERSHAGRVQAVCLRRGHYFSKAPQLVIRLVSGLGVAGDAHSGVTVKHRSRVRKDPSQPNRRQVHLIHAELFDELRAKGFSVQPGDLGENVTTIGIDLLSLPAGARLHLGATAVVEVTGLRNPCIQMDRFQQGLMAATLDQDAKGNLIRKAGVMGIVLADGDVRPGDSIGLHLPPLPRRLLQPV
jgi:MOSC domain-containing protein YiiM